MKIYDCFPFYNELDLLELRLNELYHSVDHFVIVESNTTYTSLPKPFYFDENRDRYAKFMDKIIHVKVEDMPRDANAWNNEIFQRNQILRGIKDSDPTDLILISDLDEIIRPAAIDYMRASTNNLFALRMTLYSFKLNYMRTNPDRYGIWGMATRRSLLNEIEIDALRALRFNFTEAPYQYAQADIEVIEHGGWHFGYQGNKEWLIDKARSFSHQEVNTPEFLNQIDPESSISKRTSWKQDSDDQYEIVILDSYFPKTVLDNPQKYQDQILSDAKVKSIDLLPPYPYNT